MTLFFQILGQIAAWLLIAAVTLFGSYILAFTGYMGVKDAEDYLKRRRSEAYIEGKTYND